MRKLIVLILVLLAYNQIIVAQKETNNIPGIIFDTDMGGDYDDVGAIAVLHALADSGCANILATVADVKYEGVASVINIFNTYFNRPEIPIGVPAGNALTIKDWQHWTDSILAKYPHQIKRNADVPSSLQVYRKILASQPDTSVIIAVTGFVTNLADLLNSGPDEFSSLPGKELIEKKVKLLVSMAGKFPSGREYNLYMDSASSKYVFQNWPTPVIFDGFEIGEKIKTGLPLIHNDMITNSPVKKVFSICIPMAESDYEGRMSWDEVAVLIAVKGYEPWFKLHKGRIIVNEKGSNGWDEKGAGQSYIIFDKPKDNLQGYINNLMMHQPN